MSRDDVRIELCGDLSVIVAGIRREAALHGRQGRLAIAYLALHRDQPVTREILIEAIWGVDAPSERRPALNVILSRLRSALGPGVVETAGERVRLHAARVDVEEAIAACQTALAARDAGDWRSASAGAATAVEVADRGLLPGAEAPWLEEPRRRLQEVALRAREVHTEAALASGGAAGLAAAERLATELVESAPFHEMGYVLLMRVRAAQGNPAEALGVYDRLRVLLLEELGVAPGPRAREEFGRLLRQQEEAPPVAGPRSRSFFATRSAAEFVGRRRELERLAAYFALAASGHGQVVLLEGEPGIGKTRLALQAMALCGARGALGLYGRCDAESLVPYQPFVEALRQAAATASPERVRAWAQSHGADLGRLIPQLALAEPPRAALAGDEVERFRLFEAVAGLVTDIAAAQPVVLVLDDLHWADKPTLLLLRQLVRAAEDAVLLTIVTDRDTERPPELVEALVHLRREHFLEQLSLDGLGKDDAMALVGGLGARDVPEHVNDLLWEGTRGNPFFLEEMLRHLEERRDEEGEWPREPSLPAGVREVVGHRLAALSERANRVLARAAVIGREFDLDVLATVAPVDEDELDEILDDGIRAQVLAEVPDAPGRCCFTHVLIRQTPV